jgi:hypothetical protein
MILSDLPPAEQTLSYAARSTQTRRPCVKLAFGAGSSPPVREARRPCVKLAARA